MKKPTVRLKDSPYLAEASRIVSAWRPDLQLMLGTPPRRVKSRDRVKDKTKKGPLLPFQLMLDEINLAVEDLNNGMVRNAEDRMGKIVVLMKRLNMDFDAFTTDVLSKKTLLEASKSVCEHFHWLGNSNDHGIVVAKSLLLEAIKHAEASDLEELNVLKKTQMAWREWKDNEASQLHHMDILVEELDRDGNSVSKRIFRGACPIDGSRMEWNDAETYYESLKRARMSEWIGWNTMRSKSGHGEEESED